MLERLILASEQDLTTGLLHKKERLMHMFNDMSNRRLELY